jgi:glycolate oxidase iron-sulfur subunit
MQHSIPIGNLGPLGREMAGVVEACVHCGFCLSTCPTYVTLGQEMDSPRGRIVLMKSALEGSLDIEDTLPYVDKCLGCMACVTACPSGVQYHELLNPFRALAEKKRSRNLVDTLTRRVLRETLPHPARFRLAARSSTVAVPFGRFLPKEFSAMLALLPKHLPPIDDPLPSVYPAEGPRKVRVALLVGCVQQVLAPGINRATLRVLARSGCEIVVPEGQGCCGALMMHQGDDETARDQARVNLRAFPKDVDAIVTNAAGCGSGMKEYGLLFKDMSDEEEARAFAEKVRDVSELLVELDPEVPSLPRPVTLAYHDACHLAHAQGIVEAPRRILQRIGNLTIVDVPEGELCCGSAGTYNIEQPSLADEIGRRKAENILKTGAEGVVAGNIGCMVQIRIHLAKLNNPIPVLHTIEIVDRAYRGEAITSPQVTA